jgi:hypothetical protein
MFVAEVILCSSSRNRYVNLVLASVNADGTRVGTQESEHNRSFAMRRSRQNADDVGLDFDSKAGALLKLFSAKSPQEPAYLQIQ